MTGQLHEKNNMEKILLANCGEYIEDTNVCDDVGEPKGQCVNCGCKWFEHNLGLLFGDDYRSAKQMQEVRGTE